MSSKISRRSFTKLSAACIGALGFGMFPAFAGNFKVAGIYTQPIQQKWDARLHQALLVAESKGGVEYVFF